jgi:signal transduction histidine kinase
MEDITERKTMETHARRLEQLAAMGQLLGGISHEMKNPLFVLTGRLQLLKEKLAHREYDSLGSDLQKIEDAARRMTGIAQRFLTLARPTPPSIQSCSVHDILAKVLDFLSNELMKHRIRVVREWEPALSKTQIWSDPQALHQIFLNLILNAMQAMAQAHGQGTLTVAMAISNGWIEVRIQDDGPGIPPEHQARLFNPFFTTKTAGTGTGLGLWTVRVALTELKGQVTFETEVGRGTTFVVRLPLPHEPLPAGDRGPAEG